MPLVPHAAWVGGRPPDNAYGHVAWSVPYAPGTLIAKGFSVNGKLLATDIVRTAGPPAALRLSADRKSLTADGEDTIVVQAAVVDAAGNVVPTANNRVTFTLATRQGGVAASKIAGVGNGNTNDHDPDKASDRAAFNGLCMALVQAGDTGETVTLTASSPGLNNASIIFNVSTQQNVDR